MGDVISRKSFLDGIEKLKEKSKERLYPMPIILHENEWKWERENIGSFNWSDQEIDMAKQNNDGLLREKWPYVCYLSKMVDINGN